MYRGFSSIPFETFFQLDHDSRTRGHTANKKHRCNTELRRHFFSERIINRWNKLRQESISATSINSFKQHLDKERSTRMDLFLDSPLGPRPTSNSWPNRYETGMKPFE